MRSLLLALVLLSVPAMAHADDLDDSAAICEQHKGPRTGLASQMKLWQDGWEHCQPIAVAKARRDTAKALADEEKNADLKKTRELSRKLGQ